MRYKLKRRVPNFVTVDIQTDFGWFDDIQSAKERGNEHALEFRIPSAIEWHDDDTDDSIWGMCDGWVIFRIYTDQMITEWEARRNYVLTDEDRAKASDCGKEWIPETGETTVWEMMQTPRPPEKPGWSSPEKDYNPKKRQPSKTPHIKSWPPRDTSRKSFDTGDNLFQRLFKRWSKIPHSK